MQGGQVGCSRVAAALVAAAQAASMRQTHRLVQHPKPKTKAAQQHDSGRLTSPPASTAAGPCSSSPPWPRPGRRRTPQTGAPRPAAGVGQGGRWAAGGRSWAAAWASELAPAPCHWITFCLCSPVLHERAVAAAEAPPKEAAPAHLLPAPPSASGRPLATPPATLHCPSAPQSDDALLQICLEASLAAAASGRLGSASGNAGQASGGPTAALTMVCAAVCIPASRASVSSPSPRSEVTGCH